MNKTKWALLHSLTNCMYGAFIHEIEGCIEISEMDNPDTDKGMRAAVFLNNQYVQTCVYASAEEGYVKRLRYCQD